MLEGALRHGKAGETHMNSTKRGGLHSMAQPHFGDQRERKIVSAWQGLPAEPVSLLRSRVFYLRHSAVLTWLYCVWVLNNYSCEMCCVRGTSLFTSSSGDWMLFDGLVHGV